VGNAVSGTGADAIKTAADALKSAISDALVAEGHSSDLPSAHGMTIWLSDATLLSENLTKYQTLDFASDSSWDEFLSALRAALPPESVPPAAVTDLAAGNATADSINLTWTAPGDDGNTGTARTYDVRYSTSTITDANWGSATRATGEPSPQVAGTQQSFTVTGLTADTVYYFAMKTADEVPNWSDLSNVAAATTLDTTPPAAITTLAIAGRTNGSISLSWTAVGDDGNTGTATSYDLRYSTSTITASNWDSATQVTGEPAPSAPGSAESLVVATLSEDTRYYFAIEVVDKVNNVGALSNVVSERTLASLSVSLSGGWSMFGTSTQPTQTDLPTWLGIAGLPADQWKVERWSPTARAYVSEPSTDPLLDAAEGKGFWLWLTSGRTARFSGGKVESSGTSIIPLTEGWNQITTPFEDVSINWSSVEVKTPTQSVSEAVGLENPLAAPLVSNYAWAYQNGQYQLVHGTIGEIKQMAPWEGMWILATQDCDLVLSGQATVGAVSEAAAAAEGRGKGHGRSPEVNWLVRLEAKAGEAKDPDNYLGVADRAYQIANPPPIHHFVDLRFTSAGGLAADLREESQANLSWDLEVETDLKGVPVSLSYPDLSQVPKNYRLTLYDVETGRIQQMRTTSGFTYNSGQGGIRRFRIEASRAAAGVLAIAGLTAEKARGGIMISYLLSQDAAVTVKIYNLAGTLVRALAEDLPAVAGENSVAWDARDDQGRLVPGGSYLCEITAGSEDGQTFEASRILTVSR
jgi:hypothetical protein